MIKEGIDCVLTVFGTIAWEYASFNVPVICASTNNPHIDYDFCLHAQNLEEYKSMILNFDKQKINFSKQNIYEFYFMHNIYSKSGWLINDRKELIKYLDGYENLSKLKFYDYWIRNTDLYKSEKINLSLKNFVNSKDLFIANEEFFKN